MKKKQYARQTQTSILPPIQFVAAIIYQHSSGKILAITGPKDNVYEKVQMGLTNTSDTVL